MIVDRFRIDGQVAIITGAGRGIGAASALALAECGADVVIASRTTSDLERVAHEVEALCRRAVTVTRDLSDLSAVASLATVAKNEFGRVDIVVNNVGGAIPLPSCSQPPSTWRSRSTSTWRQRTRSISPA